MSEHMTFEDRLLERLQDELPASEAPARPARRAWFTPRRMAGAALVAAMAAGAVVFAPGQSDRQALAVEKHADGTVTVRGAVPGEPRELAVALASAGIPADVVEPADGAPSEFLRVAPDGATARPEGHRCRIAIGADVAISESRIKKSFSLELDPSKLRRGERVGVVMLAARPGSGDARHPSFLVCATK